MSARGVAPSIFHLVARWRIESDEGTELVIQKPVREQCVEALKSGSPITISYPGEFQYPKNYKGVRMQRSLYTITKILAPHGDEFSVFVEPTRAK